MAGKFFFWVAFAAASASRGLAQVPVSSRCLPERSETSACVWTGDCPRGGCADKCIINERITDSWDVLLDRSFGEESYGACPLLARWVWRTLSITSSSRRRLLSDADARQILKEEGLARAASRRAVDDVHRSGRGLQSLFDADEPSSGPLSFTDYADAPVTGSLFGADEPSPGSISTSPSTSEVPSNACPLPADLDEAAPGLPIFASLIREVFTAAASSDTLPADLEDRAYLLRNPNMNQFAAQMMEDPARLKKYITEECMDETIVTPRAFEYTYWVESDDLDKLDSDLTMTQCVDNFGAWEQFARKYADVILACNPPFDAEPDCFTGIGHYMVTSTTCAAAYARMFNVSDATPLANVAANVNAIQDACVKVTTEEDCLAAKTPALDTIDQLHDDIPINNALSIDVIAVDPISAAPAVCFGDDCPPPSAEPAGEDTGGAPMAADTEDVLGLPGLDEPGTDAAPDEGASGGPDTAEEPVVDSSKEPDSPEPQGPGTDANPAAQIDTSSSTLTAGCVLSAAATLLPMLFV